jgi:hypothetical protein
VFLFSISQVAPGVTKNRPPNGAAHGMKESNSVATLPSIPTSTVHILVRRSLVNQ